MSAPIAVHACDSDCPDEVARRLGHPRNAGVTMRQAHAGRAAQGKVRRLGVYDHHAQASSGVLADARKVVRLGCPIPLVATTSQSRKRPRRKHGHRDSRAMTRRQIGACGQTRQSLPRCAVSSW
jgi:hypothetical protein